MPWQEPEQGFHISTFFSHGQGIAFTTNNSEWLGAYSANTRVNDINNDGIDDLVIGGNQLRIFFGHSGAWTNHSVYDADVVIDLAVTNQLSNPVGVGDVNNDGFLDFLTAAYWGGDDPNDTVHLILGRSTSNWGISQTITEANAEFVGRGFLGHGMDGVGDINQDGYDDFVITSEWQDKAYLVFGRPTGQWKKTSPIDQVANASFIGAVEDEGEVLGANAAGIGDVNDDGYNDFIIARFPFIREGTREGSIRESIVIFGRPAQNWQMNANISTVANFTLRFPSEHWLPNLFMGRWMAGAGDVNNDNIDDFIIGAYYDDHTNTNTGQAFLLLGRSTDQWPAASSVVSVSDYASASFIGTSRNEYAGYSVSGAGDINNDGYDDLLIGANFGQDPDSIGKAYAVFGRPTAQWVEDQSLTEADLTIAGGLISNACPPDYANCWDYGMTNGRFATTVTSVGDINNDGFDDFTISASWVNEAKGEIYLIFGADSYSDLTTTTTVASTPGYEIALAFSLAIIITIYARKRRK
ncbi:MAG: VCBS repeat-containing protein [Candidatus Heimdallarchaeota archaeon]